MTGTAQAAALVVAVVNLLAGALGSVLWYRVSSSRWAWIAIRCGQAAAALFALLAGIFYVAGMRPDDDLFWLYLLLPVAVGFVAEQLRALSAETVLEARELPNAQAMAGLDEAAQQSVVTAILRRELGIMSLSCLMTCFLALRAYGTL
jgi:hypothetical protein